MLVEGGQKVKRGGQLWRKKLSESRGSDSKKERKSGNGGEEGVRVSRIKRKRRGASPRGIPVLRPQGGKDPEWRPPRLTKDTRERGRGLEREERETLGTEE